MPFHPLHGLSQSNFFLLFIHLIFPLYEIRLLVLSLRILWLALEPKNFPLFSFKSFIVSHFKFKYSIHFNFYMRTLAQSLFFLPIDIHLFYPHWVKKPSFLHWINFHLYWKAVGHICVVDFWVLYSAPWWICLSLHQYHTALITLAVWSDLIPGSEPSHFVLLFHDYFSYSRDFFFS